MKLLKNIQLITLLSFLFIVSCDNKNSDPSSLAPTVTSTSPADDAVNIAGNHLVTVSFSSPMDPASINSSTFTLVQGTTVVTGAVTYTASMATFTPTTDMEANKVYTAAVTTGAVDMDGNAIASIYSFSFTTGDAPDVLAPTIISTNPVNNASGIARNKVSLITFSEAMDPLTINASTFTLKQGVTPVIGEVAYSGVTASFTPANILAAGVTYTATITTGAKDVVGNALAANITWNFTTASSISGPAVVNLGAAGNYVILAKTAINNIPTSNITGDLGISPAAESYITGLALTDATGYATSSEVTGQIFAADMADPTPINLTTAVNDMITAYNDAAGRSLPDFVELYTGDIGGKTLTPGLYNWTNTVTAPSSLTISGGPNDVWIFQIAGDLTVSSAVNMTLVGGAKASNIFWQVAGEVTVGTSSHFEGIILSMTSITLQSSASLNGQMLAQTAVILDGNAVTKQ